MIQSMDENVGKLMQKLEELNIDENTIIIFMSDNGGLATSEGSPTCNAPLRAGKGWLYEGGIREPLIVKWYNEIKAGSVCGHPVISTDFYPTILEMTGLSLIPNQHVDGVSFMRYLRGEKVNADRPLFWHYPHYSNQGGKPSAAIRWGNYKLIHFFENDTYELYNLKIDLSEENNIIESKGRKAEQMKMLLMDWQQEVGALFPERNPDYDSTIVTNSWEKQSH